MSRLGFAAFLVLLASLPPAGSRAGILTPPRDPHDKREVVAKVSKDPRVIASHRQADDFRKRLLRWKQRDFRALFGNPLDPNQGDDALMVGEPRGLLLSGAHSLNPADNKNHQDAYPISDVGRLVVYFGHDGESPVYVLFYLKTDQGFLKLDLEESLEKRLAWEGPRFARLMAEVDRRWRQVVGWEIDVDKEKAQSQGIESGDFAIKLRSIQRWAKEQGYQQEYSPPQGDDTPSWVWLNGEVPIASAHHDRGMNGEEATPSHFEFYRPDGKLFRDEGGWPDLDMIRWYRPDGEKMAYVVVGRNRNGTWRPYQWTWYDKDGEVVRQEEDSNEDGIPDVQGPSNLANQPPRNPLSVDQSWAVFPKLIPPDIRNPGQPERRVPLKRIPQ